MASASRSSNREVIGSNTRRHRCPSRPRPSAVRSIDRNRTPAVAEESGLIRSLTDLVLEGSIGAIAALDARGHRLGIAVNLSTQDLLDELLCDRIERRLEQFGVEPARLTLEITEGTLLYDGPRTRSTIERLHEIGVHLSIDDFGTGYSSLSYLRQLPVTELKIDIRGS